MFRSFDCHSWRGGDQSFRQHSYQTRAPWPSYTSLYDVSGTFLVDKSTLTSPWMSVWRTGLSWATLQKLPFNKKWFSRKLWGQQTDVGSACWRWFLFLSSLSLSAPHPTHLHSLYGKWTARARRNEITRVPREFETNDQRRTATPFSSPIREHYDD